MAARELGTSDTEDERGLVKRVKEREGVCERERERRREGDEKRQRGERWVGWTMQSIQRIKIYAQEKRA